ncbi:hypothetical protein TetV_190 [Tetraselmis virus 1]|uniref:Uncharacterized protein n=1 Tax=Tetraselmis virus 1 TaxID=2060617 RepID=A0A2P0VN06_9VIRU|nr:hypothetical protein QJ968_gp190 [Tetraselmis virus 1]AUF82282.1 hypothetical protein TetV_190 [Tetraselmis virus 1]
MVAAVTSCPTTVLVVPQNSTIRFVTDTNRDILTDTTNTASWINVPGSFAADAITFNIFPGKLSFLVKDMKDARNFVLPFGQGAINWLNACDIQTNRLSNNHLQHITYKGNVIYHHKMSDAEYSLFQSKWQNALDKVHI